MAGVAKKTRVNTVPECKPRRREVRLAATPWGSRQEPLISGAAAEREKCSGKDRERRRASKQRARGQM